MERPNEWVHRFELVRKSRKHLWQAGSDHAWLRRAAVPPDKATDKNGCLVPSFPCAAALIQSAHISHLRWGPLPSGALPGRNLSRESPCSTPPHNGGDKCALP